MTPASQWFGWAKSHGRWVRLVGPCASMTAAALALDLELQRLGRRPRARNQMLTTGELPRAERQPTKGTRR